MNNEKLFVNNIKDFLTKNGYVLSFSNAQTRNGLRLISIKNADNNVIVQYVNEEEDEEGENINVMLEDLSLKDVEDLAYFITHNTTESYCWMCTDDDEGYREINNNLFNDAKLAFNDMYSDFVLYLDSCNNYINEGEGVKISIYKNKITMGGMTWKVIKTKMIR